MKFIYSLIFLSFSANYIFPEIDEIYDKPNYDAKIEYETILKNKNISKENRIEKITNWENDKIKQKKVFNKNNNQLIEEEKYDKNSNLTNKIFYNENGIIKWEWIYENENSTKEIIYNPYGAVFLIQRFDKDGKRINQIFYDKVGRFPVKIVEYWRNNGQQKHIVNYLPDESKIETFHWENGRKKKLILYNPDKTIKHIEEYFDSGLKFHSIDFYEEGQKIKKEIIVELNKSTKEIFYREDGKTIYLIKTFWAYTGYKKTAEYYNKNGSVDSIICYSQNYKDVVVECKY